MLSPFGKFCRKLRIEFEEILLDMAKKLEVTPSFLSAVEVGKKNIPEGWDKILIKEYSLNAEQAEELRQAIKNSVRQLKFDLQDKNETDRELLLAFARKLNVMDTKEKESILSILNKKEQSKMEGKDG